MKGLHLEKHPLTAEQEIAPEMAFVFGSYYDHSNKLQEKSGWRFKDEHLETGIHGSSY